MNRLLSVTCLLFCLLLLGLLASPTLAQRWQWPEPAENLQVLPENTTAADLSNTMRGFTRALGVRCQHCHVGEEGTPFSEWDFASDDKPEKEIARAMMRMVQDLNTTYLAEMNALPENRVQVTCTTCHRGIARPQPLEHVLAEFLPTHGTDATIDHYHSLREQYYGSFSYDFSESVLRGFGSQLAETGQPDDALAFMELNLTYYPDSWQTLFGIGQVYLQKQDTAAAIQHLERALGINPNAPPLQRTLEALKGE